MDTVVVITPNPAVDITYRVEAQRIGVTQRVQTVTRRPGGKGLNVVRVLDALGIHAVSIAPLGGSGGAWIASRLDELGIHHVEAVIADDTRSTVTIVDDVAHPTMLGEPGPTVTSAEWSALETLLADALVDAAVLVISGSLPRGTDPLVVARWVRMAADRGVPAIVDASGPALLAAADARATVLKPNREELADATGIADEADAARALLARGARTVVVARGADGIAAHTIDDPALVVPAVPAVHGNPTGAGDAATAGLVAALVAALVAQPADRLDRATLDAALRSAAAAGAAAVLRPTAGEIDLDAFTRFHTQLTRTMTPGGPA